MFDKDFSPRTTFSLSIIMIVSLIAVSLYVWPLTDLQSIVLAIGFGLVGYLIVTTIQEKRKSKNEKV